MILTLVTPVFTWLWSVFNLWSYEGVTASSDQMQADTGLQRNTWAEFPPHRKLQSVWKWTWSEFSRWESYQTKTLLNVISHFYPERFVISIFVFFNRVSCLKKDPLTAHITLYMFKIILSTELIDRIQRFPLISLSSWTPYSWCVNAKTRYFSYLQTQFIN